MSEIRYKYAYDENGEHIDIESVSSENRHKKHFRCISCGEELIPKLGKVRTHHFAHKVANVSCNKETYLHKIGKWLLKSKFDDSESFVIEYQRKVKCKNCNSCSFYKEEECIAYEYEEFDLKNYYDTCTEEQQVGEYVADLLLTNSQRGDRKPVLIEIRVSHECTEEKQESGAKIIELRVKSEDDLLRIVDSNIREQDDKVKFIGFSRDSKERKTLGSRGLFRFALMKSGAAKVSNYEDMPACDDKERMFPSSILELNIEPDRTDHLGGGVVTVYDYGLAIAMRDGYDLRNCTLCKYRRKSEIYGRPDFCTLCRKCGTPQFPDRSYANNCRYYRIDKPKFDRILREFEHIPFTVVE